MTESRMTESRQINYSAAMLGLMMLAVGAITIADFTIDGSVWRAYWPVVVILAGLGIGARGGTALMAGGLVAAFGAAALALNLLDVDFRIEWGILAPAGLIVIGVLVLFAAVFRRQRVVGGEGALSITAIFGGSTRAVRGAVRGGRATALFGGAEMDFTQSEPGPEGVALDVFCAFGGLDITVPDTWAVDSRILALLGGVEDHRPSGAALPQPEHTLTLTGTVMLGGVEIKYARKR